MTAYLQAGVTILALALMYFVCVRPMMRKNGACHISDDRGAGLDEELQRLREEVTSLRRSQGDPGNRE